MALVWEPAWVLAVFAAVVAQVFAAAEQVLPVVAVAPGYWLFHEKGQNVAQVQPHYVCY